MLEHEFNVNGGSTWQSVNQFSYNNLAQGVIRYKHIIGAPSKDTFKVSFTLFLFIYFSFILSQCLKNIICNLNVLFKI